LKISPERLVAEAEATGFRPEVLEKAAQLLGLLNALQSHPFLREKLVLKGGTALNLFVFDVPRLSVDIDLNYVGAEDREGMLAERPKVEQAAQAVFAREGFSVRRMPEEHAGGK
jgi:predicted nucleotidyltransferase component of viral defense system